MAPEKLTDEQIVKTMELCNSPKSGKCLNKCPYYDYSANCTKRMISDAIDLINRLKAENSKLKGRVNYYKNYDEQRDIALHSRLIAEAKTEAYKEFAEKLKEKAFNVTTWNVLEPAVTLVNIYNILKEMVGEE